MSSDRVHVYKASRCPDLGGLVSAAQTSESALHAFYFATAPRLSFALSATNDEELAEEVLIRTYAQVWHRPAMELTALSDDSAVMYWLTRIALVELGAVRRAAWSQGASAQANSRNTPSASPAGQS